MTTATAAAQLVTLSYESGKGWSAPFPNLDSTSTLVLAFGGSAFLEDRGPIAELRAAFRNSTLAGCSTAGEIHGSSLLDNSISVAVMRFARTRLRFASAPVRGPADSFLAGQHLATQLQDPSLRGVLVFSDGLAVNGSELIRGLNSTLPDTVAVTGGLAGDGERFKRTWVLRYGNLEQGFVSAVGLYGEHIRISHGSKGGWDAFGPERIVTRSRGNILFELDGKPALGLYKQYLGELANGLPATALLFPLALRGSSSKSLVRTVLSVDEAAQSLIFAGDIPQGFTAQLMRANFDRLIEGARASALMAEPSPRHTAACLSIAISCVGRRLVLKDRAEEELESTLEVLPAGTKQVGFYSYGEISPYAKGHCDLHNQTMTLTTISEE